MEIDFSATWKRQHCVLRLEGARTACRTKSSIEGAAVADIDVAGLRNARAAPCSASPGEQAKSDGAAMAQHWRKRPPKATAAWKRLEIALMECSSMRWTCTRISVPAESVCSSPNTSNSPLTIPFEMQCGGVTLVLMLVFSSEWPGLPVQARRYQQPLDWISTEHPI